MAKKITFWVCVGLIIVIASVFITLGFVSVNYCPTYSNPKTIVLYQNGQSTSFLQVQRNFQNGGIDNYSQIYSDISTAFKQNSLKSLFNGTLFKDYSIESYGETQTINFSSGTWIMFHYDENQSIINNKEKIILPEAYDEILIKVEPTNEDVQLISFYLGSYTPSTKLFNYSNEYRAYGNFNKLIYNLNV